MRRRRARMAMKASVQVQRLWRGTAARLRIGAALRALPVAFECSWCGHPEPGGGYCSKCGRRQPAVAHQDQAGWRARLMRTGRRDDTRKNASGLGIHDGRSSPRPPEVQMASCNNVLLLPPVANTSSASLPESSHNSITNHVAKKQRRKKKKGWLIRPGGTLERHARAMAGITVADTVGFLPRLSPRGFDAASCRASVSS